MTPEGSIKRKISAVLRARVQAETGMWYYMPVPAGYGRSTVDYVGCYRSKFFVIEAKRPTKHPTERQEGEIEDVIKAGGMAFVINDDASLYKLTAWLDYIDLMGDQ